MLILSKTKKTEIPFHPFDFEKIMTNGYLLLEQSTELSGQISLVGAKNAVLVIIASLILTDGVSTLTNVPDSADVWQMIRLLEQLGASIDFNVAHKKLIVDTSRINRYEVSPEIMNKMRASILVMGPLLARFGKAIVALPGGCLIGARPIDYHLQGFSKMGVTFDTAHGKLSASRKDSSNKPSHARIIFEYPSVGATENIMMFATHFHGETIIINAALEPEVIDLIDVLKKMGAHISSENGATIKIIGGHTLRPINHSIIPDRLEAGALLLAASITGGTIHLPEARPDHMDIFLEKLREMGHQIITSLDTDNHLFSGIKLIATQRPKAINFKTGPYPGFPTDLQAPMMTALCLADGTSLVEETVFENRLIHAQELGKMGAQISVQGARATIRGVEALYGCEVIASDIRASCGLVLAGLRAYGQTKITGLHHWKRGYDRFENKLQQLGATIQVIE